MSDEVMMYADVAKVKKDRKTDSKYLQDLF